MTRPCPYRPFAAKTDSWLVNEQYTLAYERKYLAMSDAEVAERLSLIEAEFTARRATQAGENQS